ncbi:MAG: hypothetical protein GY853_11345 [PVC group bacterium]|nr:hypothetical protein [PVC group bacterium]
MQFKNSFVIELLIVLMLLPGVGYANSQENGQIPKRTYISLPWATTVNQPKKKKEGYPDKRKISPETVRLTVNEYYVPHISELLNKGVDYFEWLNKLDDPYLNRYKIDIRVDPADERFKLFWKRQF